MPDPAMGPMCVPRLFAIPEQGRDNFSRMPRRNALEAGHSEEFGTALGQHESTCVQNQHETECVCIRQCPKQIPDESVMNLLVIDALRHTAFVVISDLSAANRDKIQTTS